MIDLKDLINYAVVFYLGSHALVPDSSKLPVQLESRSSGWIIRTMLEDMNSWGLGKDKIWRYKGWDFFRTKEEAVEAFNESLKNPRFDGVE